MNKPFIDLTILYIICCSYTRVRDS